MPSPLRHPHLLARLGRKSYLILLLVAAHPLVLLSQSVDWPIVVANEHFALRLPASLQLAEGTFASAEEDGQQYLIVSPGRYAVRAQPTGLSEEDAAPGVAREASLVVDIQEGAEGDFNKLGDVLAFSDDELEALNSELRTGFVGEAEREGLISLERWGGTGIAELEQTPAVHVSYIIGIPGSDSDTAIDMYMVYNNDSMYYITLSYMANQAAAWKNDLLAALESMRFERR